MNKDLCIRPFKLSDLDDLYQLLSDKEVMQYIEPPYSYEQTKSFLMSAGLCEPPLIFAVEKDKQFLGYVIFHEYDANTYEIGWILHKKYWGMGYASLLTKLLISKARKINRNLVIECVSKQQATKHIALKNGFTYLTQNEGLDVYQLII